MNEKIDESVFWFVHIERLRNSRFATGACEGECVGSWLDSGNDRLKKKVTDGI